MVGFTLSQSHSFLNGCQTPCSFYAVPLVSGGFLLIILGEYVLITSRGAPRVFHSLDTLHAVFLSLAPSNRSGDSVLSLTSHPALSFQF